jgi:transglycosylase-like protein
VRPLSAGALVMAAGWLTVLLMVAAKTAFGGYRGLTQIRYADAWCESAGNIHAVGYRGWYRGKWQFDWSTWQRFAPRGWKYTDPASAPEWVQDRAAVRVTYDAWPNC